MQTTRNLSRKVHQGEWEDALTCDPTGEKRKLIPIKIDEFVPEPLLRRLVFIDLTGMNEHDARERLLKCTTEMRGKPDVKSDYPVETASPRVDCWGSRRGGFQER